MMKTILLSLFISLCTLQTFAQLDTVVFTEEGAFLFDYVLPYSAYSSWMHRDGEPVLYAACRELGLVTFSIADISAPYPTDTIPIAAFHNLNPTNVSQFEDYLFVSLGGYNLFSQRAGLAILELSDPEHPVVVDVWDSIAFNQGAAIAISDGHYAYIGAMDAGVIILDVSDKSDIQFVSSILPDPNFPEIPDLFSVPNARGLGLYGADTLMVTYDAGGLRMIDIVDRYAPVEIGKFADTEIESIAQSAYNNIVIRDHYAYVPVDMCGLLVIDISSSDMHTVTWLNPWDCDTTNWAGRPGHTNEVRFSTGDAFNPDLLFLSAADIEVIAYSIADPAHPVEVGSFGVPGDSAASWSMDVMNNLVSVALVDNQIVGVPYYSDLGGIRLLSFEASYLNIETTMPTSAISVFPNPASQELHIVRNASGSGVLQLYDIRGKLIDIIPATTETVDINWLPAGLYYLFGNDGYSDIHVSWIKQ